MGMGGVRLRHSGYDGVRVVDGPRGQRRWGRGRRALGHRSQCGILCAQQQYASSSSDANLLPVNRRVARLIAYYDVSRSISVICFFFFNLVCRYASRFLGVQQPPPTLVLAP